MPPPIGLHIASLSLSYLVVTYKIFASKCQRMPQFHIQVQIYLLFLTLGLADLDIKQVQPQLCIRIILFPPSMSPLCDSASYFSLQKPIAQMRLPLLGGVSTECAKFWYFPTTCKVTLGQEISHCGSGISLGNCMLVPSTDTLSSLPT